MADLDTSTPDITTPDPVPLAPATESFIDKIEDELVAVETVVDDWVERLHLRHAADAATYQAPN